MHIFLIIPLCMIVGAFFPRFVHVVFTLAATVAGIFALWCVAWHYGWVVA